MKKFVNKLPLVAFVFALVAAFAFNMPEADDLNWFEVDSSGAIGTPIASEPTCPGNSSYCAVGLTNDQVGEMDNDPSVSDYQESEISLKRKL